MKRAIVFPGGAGGNHLRWLLYLDSSVAEHLSINEKVDFILSEIYSKERTFHNWLPLEARWRYLDHYESFVKILHEPKDDVPESTTVFLTFDDWDKVLVHYACLTGCFSSETMYNRYENFLHEFDKKIVMCGINGPNKLILKSDVFFDNLLDRNYYNSVINLFGFEDHYEEAKIIHAKWAEARQRARNDFYKFYTSAFLKNFLVNLTTEKDITRRTNRNGAELP